MLRKEKFEELCTADKEIKSFYSPQLNGFYKCKDLEYDEKIV